MGGLGGRQERSLQKTAVHMLANWSKGLCGNPEAVERHCWLLLARLYTLSTPLTVWEA